MDSRQLVEKVVRSREMFSEYLRLHNEICDYLESLGVDIEYHYLGE